MHGWIEREREREREYCKLLFVYSLMKNSSCNVV